MRGIAIIIFSFGLLVWPNVGLAQGAIYKWVDSKGTVHYSNTPTRAARSIDAELPPAASFGTHPDSASQTETPPPALPAQEVPAALPAQEVPAAADATKREEIFNQGEGETEGSQVGQDEDFALGRDGPFGPDSSNAFED